MPRRSGDPHPLLSILAAPVAHLYRKAVLYRRERFAAGRTSAKSLSRPVISVGNLTVGGTGKTPLTIELARSLSEAGLAVSVLSRGYGGNRQTDPMEVKTAGTAVTDWRQVGDEPFLIAREAPKARVTVGRSRHAAGVVAEASGPVDLHILDDGFQHLELRRDLDIVMVSAECPLRRARCLPAGPYREPPAALRHADMVVVKSQDGAIAEPLRIELDSLVAPGSFVAGAHFEAIEMASLVPTGSGSGASTRELSWLRDRAVSAFAAIGEPHSFMQLLRRLDARVVHFEPFPDHHAFRPREIARLSREARAAGAEALVCTSKDAVRAIGCVDSELLLPVLELRGRLQVADFESMLRRIFQRVHVGPMPECSHR